MDYEKLHKDTITKLQEMVNSGKITVETARNICADFVPESEDERIRKHLISLFEKFVTLGVANECETSEIKVDDILAWLEKQGEKSSDKIVEKARIEKQRVLLTETDGSANIDWDCRSLDDVKILLKCGLEFIRTIEANKQMPTESRFNGCSFRVPTRYDKGVKQGEQKSTDKVEPKFEIGDLITNGILVGKIDRIYEWGYHVYFGDYYSDVTDAENWHKWTIQDAKDGDVLACENGWTCIFKSLINNETFSSYCFMDKTEWFCKTGSKCHILKEEFVKAYNAKIHPASKEQRDLLFQKMKEAGYEWDAEKKELKKAMSKFK